MQIVVSAARPAGLGDGRRRIGRTVEDDRKPPKANGGVATATAPDKDAPASGEAAASGRSAAAEGSPGKHQRGAPGEASAPAKGQDTPAGRQGQQPAGGEGQAGRQTPPP